MSVAWRSLVSMIISRVIRLWRTSTSGVAPGGAHDAHQLDYKFVGHIGGIDEHVFTLF